MYHLVKNYHQRVLVCAPSNVAVDNLAYKLHNMALYVGGEGSELSRLNRMLQVGEVEVADD